MNASDHGSAGGGMPNKWSPQDRTNRTALLVAAVLLALLVGAGVFAYQANDEVKLAVNGMVDKLDPSTKKVEIPSGTKIVARLETTLTTKESRVGDRFVATVVEPVLVDGEVAIPAGAEISGQVVLAKQPGKASGRGQLQLAYEDVRFGGREFALNTQSIVYESESGTKKDAALIGGGAIGGALIGGIAGGSAGDAAKGAVVGGAAGTATSLMTRGPQLELPAGTTLVFRLDETVEVVPVKVAA